MQYMHALDDRRKYKPTSSYNILIELATLGETGPVPLNLLHGVVIKKLVILQLLQSFHSMQEPGVA